MKGQTCGLCGRADGEVKQERRMPSGRLTKSAVSYAHSWAQPGKSCQDSSGQHDPHTFCFFQAQSRSLTFLPSLRRLLDEARVGEAEQADLHGGRGVQVLFGGARAPLPARLRAAEDHAG